MPKTRKLADGTEITHAQNDARYIEQGKQVVLKDWHDDSEVMRDLRKKNHKKNGHPFEYPDALFISLALVRAVCGMSYRMLEGMTQEALDGYNAPHYTVIRNRILELNTAMLGKVVCNKIGEGKFSIRIIPDGTGLEPSARSEFIRAKHAVRRGFVRFTAIIDHDTMKILSFEITDERTGEASNLETTVEEALESLGIDVQERKEKVAVAKTAQKIADATARENGEKPNEADSAMPEIMPKITLNGDGLYSRTAFYGMCEQFGIDLMAPVQSNSVAKVQGKKGGHLRKQAVLDQLAGGASATAFASMTDDERKENKKEWKKRVDYGRRWLVEIVFSAFKRKFGSAVRSIHMKNIVREISFKVYAYNMLLDLAREAMARA